MRCRTGMGVCSFTIRNKGEEVHTSTKIWHPLPLHLVNSYTELHTGVCWHVPMPVSVTRFHATHSHFWLGHSLLNGIV